MDWFYILIGLIIYCVGFAAGGFYIKEKFLHDKTIGSLRVDRSDEDGPLVFMEVDPGFRDFAEMDVLVLKVKHEDFIPRK
jgi:hypothetical protein